jgi:pimeloyl-ACP methyl ester carboxylesterase
VANEEGSGTVEFRRDRVRVRDDVELSVRVAGDGDLPVLFVHGWMVSGAVWDRVLPTLDLRGRRLIVPDQRGAGESDKPQGPYSLSQYADDLLATLDALSVERAVVVGHSMGGQLALYLAAHAPSRVRSVLGLCPVPPSGMALPPDAAGLFRTSANDRGKQGIILGLACKSLVPEEKERLLDDAGRVSAACVEGAYDAWTGGGFADRLADVRASVLVLATDDPFLPPAFLSDTIVSRVADARMAVLPGAGHYPQCERPAETAAIIEAFLCTAR